jgi:hypothetical protein
MMDGQDGGLQVSTNSSELLQLTELDKVTQNKALYLFSVTQIKRTGKLLYFNHDTSSREPKILDFPTVTFSLLNYTSSNLPGKY